MSFDFGQFKKKEKVSKKPVTVVNPQKRTPKVELKGAKIRLVKESDLFQLIIDINQERIAVPEHVKEFFQKNTTNSGGFRGKRKGKDGGRIDGTLKRVIESLVDSKILFVKKGDIIEFQEKDGEVVLRKLS